MTKRIVLSTLVMTLALSLFMPHSALADEDAPPEDAPYQQAEETMPEPTPQVEPAVEEPTTPTLPTVYNSPMTPIEPEKTIVAAEESILHTTTPVIRRRLPVNLVSTLLIQSMRQSPIWSGL